MSKLKGFKVIVTTNEDDDYCEELLNKVIGELTSRERMDMLIKMTDEEIKKEYNGI